MSTVQIGDEFENRVFLLFSKMLEEGNFFLPIKNYKIFQKKHYYSEKRQDDIIFDIAIESYLPDQDTPSFIVFIECKKYSSKVPISDLEEFQSKVLQIAPNANKSVLVTNSSFSEQGVNFARSNHIALVRMFDDDKINWLVLREVKDCITHEDVEIAKKEVEKALIDSDYRIINNAFVFYNEEPIYDCLGFLESLYKAGNFTTHYASELILEKIYEKEMQIKNIEYLSDEKLIEIALSFRREMYHRYDNKQLKLEINQIQQYLSDNFDFCIDFVDDLHITKPVHYLAYINYEDRLISILNHILRFENRLRFTLIHELSHLILHEKFLQKLKSNKSLIFLSKETKERIEIQANKLTSYILLPPNKLLENLNIVVSRYNLNNDRGYYLYLDSQPCNRYQWHHISNYFCNKFGISEEVIKIRLREIGFLKIENQDIESIKTILNGS